METTKQENADNGRANKRNRELHESEVNKAYAQWTGRGCPKMSDNHIWTNYEAEKLNELLNHYNVVERLERNLNLTFITKRLSIALNMQVSQAAVWKYVETKYPNIDKSVGEVYCSLEAPLLFSLPKGDFDANEIHTKVLNQIEQKYGLK